MNNDGFYWRLPCQDVAGGMKVLIIKIPDQVAFAILSSWYYRSYLTEYRARYYYKEVSKHELNNREWIDRVFKLL